MQRPGREQDAVGVTGTVGLEPQGPLGEAGAGRAAAAPGGRLRAGGPAAGAGVRPPSGPANLHLRAPEGVVEALPLGPVDAVGVGEVGAAQVEAVEVGEVAAAEPEGARGQGRAVLHEEVLVPVEGGELLAAVVGQGVAWRRAGGPGAAEAGGSLGTGPLQSQRAASATASPRPPPREGRPGVPAPPSSKSAT